MQSVAVRLLLQSGSNAQQATWKSTFPYATAHAHTHHIQEDMMEYTHKSSVLPPTHAPAHTRSLVSYVYFKSKHWYAGLLSNPASMQESVKLSKWRLSELPSASSSTCSRPRTKEVPLNSYNPGTRCPQTLKKKVFALARRTEQESKEPNTTEKRTQSCLAVPPGRQCGNTLAI